MNELKELNMLNQSWWPVLSETLAYSEWKINKSSLNHKQIGDLREKIRQSRESLPNSPNQRVRMKRHLREIDRYLRETYDVPQF